jgi:hypothetical protein
MKESPASGVAGAGLLRRVENKTGAGHWPAPVGCIHKAENRFPSANKRKKSYLA